MTEILNEGNERIYVTTGKRYRLFQDVTEHYSSKAKYGVDCEVWTENGTEHGATRGWVFITRIYRTSKKEAFEVGLRFLVAFHDGE